MCRNYKVPGLDRHVLEERAANPSSLQGSPGEVGSDGAEVLLPTQSQQLSLSEDLEECLEHSEKVKRKELFLELLNAFYGGIADSQCTRRQGSFGIFWESNECIQGIWVLWEVDERTWGFGLPHLEELLPQ